MICVLGVEAGNRATPRVLLLFALLEGAHRSLEEVKTLISNDASSAWSAAAVLAVGGKDAVGLVSIADVELVLNPLTA